VLNCKIALTVEKSPLYWTKDCACNHHRPIWCWQQQWQNCSHSTPSVAHDSPSFYISATEIPLPEDTMEDDGDCLGAMERELGSQCQSLNDICDQLIMLITLCGGVNTSVEAPPAVTNAVVAPLNPLNTITHWLKPVTPSKFTGDLWKDVHFSIHVTFTLGWPIPSLPMTKQGFIGSSFYERWSCCTFHRSNDVTHTANWITPMGDLGWIQTWVHMWLLPKEWGPNGLHRPGDI